MGFFGKKKTEETNDTSEEATLKAELESEVESLQKEFREKQHELENITQKISSVKEEYDSMVGNLMLVKKELNQKNMELDIIKREYRETKERNKKSELIKDVELIDKFKVTEGEYSKIKEELEGFTKKYEEIKEQIAQEQSTLHNIKKQQVEVEKELDGSEVKHGAAKGFFDWELDIKHYFDLARGLLGMTKYEVPALIKIIGDVKNKFILDMGCGFGDHAQKLSKKNYKICLVL